MNLKATDEIVGDPTRPKSRIRNDFADRPNWEACIREQMELNARAKLRFEMLPKFEQVNFTLPELPHEHVIGGLWPTPRPEKSNRQREMEALMNITQQQIDNLCGIPDLRAQIETAKCQALTHGIGWVGIDAAAVDIWAVPIEPENAATLREHADIPTGCTENDPVMDSDRARVEIEAKRQAAAPTPVAPKPAPLLSDGLLTEAPIGQRVGGGRWGL